MTLRNDKQTVSALAQLLYSQEQSLISGNTKLSLTTHSLTDLNEGIEKLRDVECMENCRSLISGNKYLMEIEYLQRVLGKIPCLKIIHGTSTIQGRVDVSCFCDLRHLEIRKVPIHLLEGLNTIRSSLLSITCSRSIQNLQDVFVSCGGDMSGAQAWNHLKAACLSANHIEQLDNSLRYLPVLEYLDLSYNKLNAINGHLEILTDLLHVNLGFNELQSVPTFSPIVSSKLTTLILRNNNLDNIEGIESLSGLMELDLCDNCLAEHNKLQAVSFLHHITSLNVCGNPLYYHINHRPLTLQYISPLAVKKRGKQPKSVLLDGKLITDSDKVYIAKDPAYFVSGPSTSGFHPHLQQPGSIHDEWSFDSLHHRVEAQIHNSIGHPRSHDLADNQSRDGMDSDTGSRQGRKGKKRARKVLITDLDSSCDVGDNASSREPSRPVTPKLSSSVTDRANIEAARKQLGPDWLVSVNEKYYSTSQQPYGSDVTESVLTNGDDEMNPFDFAGGPTANYDRNTISGDAETPNDHVMTSKVPDDAISDTKVVLDERSDTEVVRSDTKVARSDVMVRCTSEEGKLDWSWSSDQQKETEDLEGEPFIVTRENGCQLMAIVGTKLLLETDFNNQVSDRLDLSTLKSARLVENDIKTDSDVDDTEEQDRHRVNLSFDSLRSDRRRRVYLMEDSEHAQQFLNLLQPFLDKISDAFRDLLHCMKCDAQFTTAQQNLDGSCPKCAGNIVIQLEESDLNPTPGDCPVGSLKSTDSLPLPLAASSRDCSPNKTNGSGGTSYKSMEAVGSMPSDSLFRTAHDDSSISRHQSASDIDTVYQSASDSTNSSQTTDQSTPKFTGNSSSKFTDKKFSSDTETTVLLNGSSDKNSNSLKSSRKNAHNQFIDPSTVASCPSIGRAGAPRSQIRPRLDSEESDITIISNPSLSSITVLPNPSREIQIQIPSVVNSNRSTPRTNGSSPVSARSLSLDEGKQLLNAYMTSPIDDVITDRENPELVSPCGSLTTKTVTSMIDSMYERNLSTSDNDNDSGNEVERTEHVATVVTEGFDKLTTNDEVTSLDEPSRSRDSIVYDYEKYSVVDHRMKLWMAMSVFSDGEDFQLLLKCDMCRYGKVDLQNCIFIVTNSNIHIYKVIGTESPVPANWLTVVAKYPKTSIRYLNIGYQYQWFQVEFTDSLYSFVMRDEHRCKRFITAFTAVIEDTSLSNRSELLGITKNYQTTVDKLCALCSDHGDEDDTGRLFTGFAVRGKGNIIPVTVIVTSENIYLTNQNYEWPPPRGPDSANNTATPSKAQFTLVNNRKINEISCMNFYSDAPLSVIISFFSEDVTTVEHSDWSASWMITMETDQALKSLTDAIRSPWEAEFGVELQTFRQSVTPSRTT